MLAERLGRPVNSVSKSLARIRRALLKCMREAASSESAGHEEEAAMSEPHWMSELSDLFERLVERGGPLPTIESG